MSKIVVLYASPRKGNSYAIANAIAESAKSKGNQIVEYKINDIRDGRGCQSCFGCKKAGHCVVNDGFTPALDDIRDADGVIVATPTYFGVPSGQYRLLSDRFFSFLNGDFSLNIAPGKKVAIVQTCGTGVDQAKASLEAIKGTFVNFFKFECVGDILYQDAAPKTPADNADVMAKAKAIGSKF